MQQHSSFLHQFIFSHDSLSGRFFFFVNKFCFCLFYLFIYRSPTASSKDPYEAFNLPLSKRSMDSPPVIPPRLSPESNQPPPTARSFFSESLIARLSQDPNLARFLKSSSVDQPSINRQYNNGYSQQQQQQLDQQQQQQRASSLFHRRISAEGLQLRR